MEKEMPEGYEWPRYESGEPVQIGDDVIGPDHGEIIHVSEITFHPNGVTLGIDDWYESDARFKRPATIAADGKPLEVGQTVWGEVGTEFAVKSINHKLKQFTAIRKYDGCECSGLNPMIFTHQRPVLDAEWNRIEPAMDVWWVCEGDERGTHAEKLHVESIGDDGLVTCSPFNCGTWVEVEPSTLYVHKPVLDADGVPIHEGDTVYLLPGEWCGEYPLCGYSAGDEMVVKELCPDHEVGGVLKCAGDGKCNCFPLPFQLTHTKPEPPDSWDSVWMDVSNGCETPQGMERRCKALAERGE